MGPRIDTYSRASKGLGLPRRRDVQVAGVLFTV
jgi:hypothetical protein